MKLDNLDETSPRLMALPSPQGASDDERLDRPIAIFLRQHQPDLMLVERLYPCLSGSELVQPLHQSDGVSPGMKPSASQPFGHLGCKGLPLNAEQHPLAWI